MDANISVLILSLINDNLSFLPINPKFFLLEIRSIIIPFINKVPSCPIISKPLSFLSDNANFTSFTSTIFPKRKSNNGLNFLGTLTKSTARPIILLLKSFEIFTTLTNGTLSRGIIIILPDLRLRIFSRILIASFLFSTIIHFAYSPIANSIEEEIDLSA